MEENNHHQEPTIQDVLDAMSVFATNVERDIGTLKADVGTLKADVGTLKADVGTLKAEMGTLKYDVGYLKNNMVTKDYLDRFGFKFKGEIGGWMRKADDKVNAAVDLLLAKKVITPPEHQQIYTNGPF